MSLRVGQRVRMTDLALQNFLRPDRRHGVVCRLPKDPQYIIVLPDGTKSPVKYAAVFWEPEDAVSKNPETFTWRGKLRRW